MSKISDLTRFIFKVEYNKKDTIIFPATISEAINGLIREEKVRYKVYMLYFIKGEYRWNYIAIDHYEKSQEDFNYDNIYFTEHGKRIAILHKTLRLEVLDSYMSRLKCDKLDESQNISRILLYLSHTRPSSSIKFNETYMLTYRLTSDSLNKSIKDVVYRFIKYLNKNGTEQTLNNLYVLIDNVKIFPYRLLTTYRDYHTCVYDPVVKFETVNPVIDSIYNSLMYLNISMGDHFTKPFNHTVSRQLNGTADSPDFTIVKRRIFSSILVDMYDFKAVKNIKGAVVYTKDCLLRIVNAKG